MQPTRTPEGVRVGGDARVRLYDARGYGRPLENGDLLLAPVEAAYLLHRGDLEAVDGRGFREFVRREGGGAFVVRLLAFKDLRERGFYVRRAHPELDGTDAEFRVLERGSDPGSGDVAYDVRVLDERDTIRAGSLDPGALGIVDEEGEVGYIAVGRPAMDGNARLPRSAAVAADLVGDRAIVWEPPPALYRDAFFGQPLAGRDDTAGPLQLSLVEAAYLAERGLIDLGRDADAAARGRRVEGDRFDRRYAAYVALRDAGVVPKTGYKFGADFRLYRRFDSVEEMGHSDELVRVLDPDATLVPHALALDVRLAHGVGKRMVFALTPGTGDTTITWLSIERLTP